MTDAGELSIGQRFKLLEKRMQNVEDRIVEMRLEQARQQLKLAIAVGLANLVAFGIVEYIALWLRK
jgi:hypothetical protein